VKEPMSGRSTAGTLLCPRLQSSTNGWGHGHRAAPPRDKEYLRTRSRLIDMKKAQTPQYGVPASGGTVYLTAADATGMMVSYIQSNYQGLDPASWSTASACGTGAAASCCGPVMPTSSRRASGRFTRSSLRSSRRTDDPGHLWTAAPCLPLSRAPDRR
jgi:hypothetical protein